MKFEKRNFMGIELDVLVGHPEHDLLFVATQVARAAGLKNPSHAVANYHRCRADHTGLKPWTDVKEVYHSMIDPSGTEEPSYLGVMHLQARSWMASESWVYSMLLKGRAEQSEPFRKWVTEEVLPTIRKTGKYDAEQSTNPIAMGLMDELKALRGASVREKQGARWVLPWRIQGSASV